MSEPSVGSAPLPPPKLFLKKTTSYMAHLNVIWFLGCTVLVDQILRHLPIGSRGQGQRRPVSKTTTTTTTTTHTKEQSSAHLESSNSSRFCVTDSFLNCSKKACKKHPKPFNRCQHAQTQTQTQTHTHTHRHTHTHTHRHSKRSNAAMPCLCHTAGRTCRFMSLS